MVGKVGSIADFCAVAFSGFEADDISYSEPTTFALEHYRLPGGVLHDGVLDRYRRRAGPAYERKLTAQPNGFVRTLRGAKRRRVPFDSGAKIGHVPKASLNWAFNFNYFFQGNHRGHRD